jgi:hypothetical protein
MYIRGAFTPVLCSLSFSCNLLFIFRIYLLSALCHLRRSLVQAFTRPPVSVCLRHSLEAIPRLSVPSDSLVHGARPFPLIPGAHPFPAFARSRSSPAITRCSVTGAHSVLDAVPRLDPYGHLKPLRLSPVTPETKNMPTRFSSQFHHLSLTNRNFT